MSEYTYPRHHRYGTIMSIHKPSRMGRQWTMALLSCGHYKTMTKKAHKKHLNNPGICLDCTRQAEKIHDFPR